jgi:hypothetical protein
MAKDTETDKGKETILPPNPKKSFLDRAPNRLARKISQIRTGHWLSATYLKRVRKIAARGYLVYAGGVGSSGCLARMMYPPGFGECRDHNLGPPRGTWSKRQTAKIFGQTSREGKVGKATS